MNNRVIQLNVVSGSRILPPVAPAEPSSINICENDACYEIRTALPGVDIEDVIIGVVDDVLTIGAKVCAEMQQTVGSFFAVDHRISLVEQSFALPADADAQSLSTSFNDGVLSVLMARAPSSNVVPIFLR